MNKFKKILQINFLVLGFVIVSGCGDAGETVVVDDSKEDNMIVENNKTCEVDSDCVPASCCHSTDVVNKENAPSCENLKCTLSCETILDCGQGRPVCNNGQCEIERNVDGNLGVEEIEDVQSDICIKEGDGMTDVIIPEEKRTKCCVGLTSRTYTYINDNGECKIGKGSVCTYCGNGECGKGETKCNCSEDCKE